MGDPGGNRELDTAYENIRLLQEHLRGDDAAASLVDPAQAAQAQVEISDLAAELTKLVQVPAEGEFGIQEKENDAAQVETVATVAVNTQPVEEVRGRTVEVPVRQRTTRAREGAIVPPPPVPVAPRTFTMELPATPFHPAAPATEGLAAPPTHPTPGLPANTPMAVEVLASLCALGLQFNGRPAYGRASAAPAAQGMSAPAPRRNAAIRATQAATAAAAAARPRVRARSTTKRSCNCKRSQCLKLYCECFAGSGFCMPGCSCQNCLNTENEVLQVEAARAVILAKDPAAFDDKVTVADGHKKGCKCKRSKCLKKYCECYNGGVKCNPDVCQCDGCENAPEGPGVADPPAQTMAVPFSGPVETPAPMKTGSVQIPLFAEVAQQQPLAHELPLLSPLGTMPWMIQQADVTTAAAAAATAAAAAAAKAMFGPMGFQFTSFTHAQDPPAIAQMPAGIANPSAPVQQQQQPVEEQPIRVESAPAIAAIDQDHSIAALNATEGGTTPAVPSASALVSHLSDMRVDSDGEVADTASSPALHAARAALARRAATTTMTGGNAVPKAGGLSRRPVSEASVSEGAMSMDSGAEGSQRSKRPRRAASGGVMGAIAAETSDWGLDHISPPLKRSASETAADVANIKGTAAARLERNALLRKALHNETVAARHAEVDEADAISALVSLNNSQA